jgi:hypothetical protein
MLCDRLLIFFLHVTFFVSTDLLEIDGWLPELILCLVKVPHSNFAEVARMVFVDVRSVMVLATCHTATTRMLSVLAYTTMTCRDMAATRKGRCQPCSTFMSNS